MNKKREIEESLKRLKPRLQDQFKIKEIGYFGSLAKDTLDSNSDVDLLVEFSEPIGWEFFDLKNLLEAELDRPVDLVTKNALKKQLRKSILNQVKYL